MAEELIRYVSLYSWDIVGARASWRREMQRIACFTHPPAYTYNSWTH